MVRFIHTADWQIGKGYGSFADEAAMVLRQERIGAIDRIAAVAQEFEAAYVVVAGDLWDAPTLPMEIVNEAFAAIGRVGRPVVVIPGNHDHGGPDGIWQRQEVQGAQKRYAPNLQLLTQPGPHKLADTVLMACPLLRRHSAMDPTDWLGSFNWDSLPPDQPRLVLAHGSVTDFGQRLHRNIIDLKRLSTMDVDYIALGDWHRLKQVGPKAWYCGTPEPDQLGPNDESSDRRDQVLLVEVERNQKPHVESRPTGGLRWHHLRAELSSAEDLHRLQQSVDQRIGNRVRRDLLSLDIGHSSLDLASHASYVQWQETLAQQLLVVVSKGSCTAVPRGEDLDSLLKGADAPLIRSVASQLQQQLEGPQPEIASKALEVLFHMVQKRSTQAPCQ